MLNYYKLKENPKHFTHIRVDVYYDLGGYNYFTGQEKRRGYWVTIAPVEKGNGVESVTAFTGLSYLLKGVARKSKKAEEEALQIYDEYYRELIVRVLDKNSLNLEDIEGIAW